MLHLLGQSDPASSGEAISLSAVVAPYMPVFFAAFFVAFVLTPLMRVLAMRNGVVDWPDLARKNHIQPVAYLGGVAIFLGWLAGVALCFLDVLPDSTGVFGFPLGIIVGAAAITLTGLFDDVYGISPRVKVGGQLFAAAALATQGLGQRVVDTAAGLVGLDLPWSVVYVLGTIVIAAFVVGGCNAVNLLDGLDGLAAGVTGIATAGFLVIAAIVASRVVDPATPGSEMHQWTDPKRLVMCLAILGGILGFLPYNFNPATIFMGDAGSLLLGYLAVTTILLFGEATNQSLILITAALIVFALPITDTSLAIFRRKMAGQPIFSPDNRHIHHLLRRSGMTVRQAVMTMYGVATMFALLGIAMVALELRWRYILAVFFVLYGFIMVTAYKYGQQQAILDARQKAQDETEAAERAAALPTAPGNGHAGHAPHATTASRE